MRGPRVKRPIVLIITADPGSIPRDALPSTAVGLTLDSELEDIWHARATAPFDDFELISKRAVTVSDLLQLLWRFNPAMLYFAGHGVSARRAPEHSSVTTRDIEPVTSGQDSGIILLDGRGRPVLLAAATLAGIIATAAPALRIAVTHRAATRHHARARHNAPAGHNATPQSLAPRRSASDRRR